MRPTVGGDVCIARGWSSSDWSVFVCGCTSLDPGEDLLSCLSMGPEAASVDEFSFHHVERRFRDGVVPADSGRSERAFDADFGAVLGELGTGVLASGSLCMMTPATSPPRVATAVFRQSVRDDRPWRSRTLGGIRCRVPPPSPFLSPQALLLSPVDASLLNPVPSVES